MKTSISILSLLIILAVSLGGCKKKKTTNTTKNDLTVPIIQEGVKGIDSITPLPISLPIEWKDTLDSQVDATLSANGVSKSQIKSAFAKSMTIDMLGSAQSFNFIDDSVKIYVDKVGGTAPILIASKHGIPANATTLTFDVISSDIKDFFTADLREMTLKFNTKANQGILSNTQVHYKMEFNVTYTPL